MKFKLRWLRQTYWGIYEAMRSDSISTAANYF